MIPIGTVLTLELQSAERSEKFKCRLVDKKGEDFYIDYPISLQTNKVAFLFNGTQIKATFVGSDGASVFLFESEIKGRIKSNIPMLIVSYPGDDHLIKIQRRQYVRIETAMDIALHPLNFEFVPITTVADDISAGGTAVFVPADANLNEGMTIQAWMVLLMQNGEYHYMKLLSKVVRIVPNIENRHRVSLQFKDVTSYDRQFLLRFCFERQLELKKKGLSS